MFKDIIESPDVFADTLIVSTSGTPGAARADTVKLMSEDLSSGNTIPSIRTEGSGIFASGTPASAAGSIAIKINGTVYYFTVATSAAS